MIISKGYVNIDLSQNISLSQLNRSGIQFDLHPIPSERYPIGLEFKFCHGLGPLIRR